MGLDMFLNKGNGQGEIDWSDDLAYWRKANHIHLWFVKNIQDGTDDCESYLLTQDKLKELIATCERLVESKFDVELCKELLPTGAGFFFGGTDYGECYIHDVEYTLEQLKKLVDVEYKLYYTSSW